MKFSYLIITIATTAIAFLSCEKKKEDVIQITSVSNKASLKFVNVYTALTPSTATTPNGPSVDIFVNGKKINATAIGYASVFPAPAAYSAVDAGLGVNVKVVLNRTGGSTASDTISNKNYNLAAGSFTTIFLVDTLPNPTPLSPIVLPIGESVTSAKFGFYKMRFINMIPSGDTLEVFSKNLNAVVLPGVRYKNATEWVELPVQRKNDTLQLRKVGTTTVLFPLQPFLPTSERVYTIYSRGLITATTGTRPRALTFYTNK